MAVIKHQISPVSFHYTSTPHSFINHPGVDNGTTGYCSPTFTYSQPVTIMFGWSCDWATSSIIQKSILHYRRGKAILFSKASRPPAGPTLLPIQWARKRSDFDHSVPSTTKAKNVCNDTSAPPYTLWACTGTTLHFPGSRTSQR